MRIFAELKQLNPCPAFLKIFISNIASPQILAFNLIKYNKTEKSQFMLAARICVGFNRSVIIVFVIIKF